MCDPDFGQTVAIIPARGGSKRLKGKNKRMFLGKPLITWTIEQALEADRTDIVIVSTDDPEIEQISNNIGARTINRPLDLASDTSSTVDAVFHALEILKTEGTLVKTVVLLQPTSPIRAKGRIDDCITDLENSDAEAVVSVCKSKDNPFWTLIIKDGVLIPLFPEYSNSRSQDLPEAFSPNGSIYAVRVAALVKQKTFIPIRALPYLMPPEESVDIDDELDFKVAEVVAKMSFIGLTAREK